jgi:hypothetical protein
MKSGQHLPAITLNDQIDLIQHAEISASSTLLLHEMPPADIWKPLAQSAAQMLPVGAGKLPGMSANVRSQTETDLVVELRKSSKPFNHTPDEVLETLSFRLIKGEQVIAIKFESTITEDCYAFVCFLKNEAVELQYSDKRITGVLSVFNKINPAVSNYGKQEPPEDLGIESFEFWCPERRPNGFNIAMKFTEPLKPFSPAFLKNGLNRPVSSTNAWVAGYDDETPLLSIRWDRPMSFTRLVILFDADYDNPLETVLMQQPERVMPCCVEKLEVLNCNNEVIHLIENNYLSRRIINFPAPVTVMELKLRLFQKNGSTPVSLFGVSCYSL